MTTSIGDHVGILARVAHRVMTERGLEPDFPDGALRQALAATGPATEGVGEIRDLRQLPWASIDNDDSRDLDQLTVAESLSGGRARVTVAIADVDGLVPEGSPADRHARVNTTTVYTAGGIFPMLPERFSTDLTSLNPGEDRLAIAIAYVVDDGGTVAESEVFRARVHNQAQLAYSAVGAWLDDTGPMPAAMARADGVAEQIRLQDAVAGRMRARRYEHGALDLETLEPKAVFETGLVVDLVQEPKNRAHQLIEDFMIAANGVTTRYLNERGIATFRRVVRSPRRWDRIVDLAAEQGERLPPKPDSKALGGFLARRKIADPLRFPDLSLTIVKLLGSGEYVVQLPGESPIGHFGLAVRDYAHSTAPNRRYPDIVTQRLLKAALAGGEAPYSVPDLHELARHCTVQEDAAQKVERQVDKSAAALLLSDRVGERFDGLVTGASDKGTWVRVLEPPVEGKVVRHGRDVDVGDAVRVRLVAVDVGRGHIDFAIAD